MVPLLNAGMIVVAMEFNVTLADMTMISGEQILVLGCIAPAVSAISRKYGKLPCCTHLGKSIPY